MFPTCWRFDMRCKFEFGWKSGIGTIVLTLDIMSCKLILNMSCKFEFGRNNKIATIATTDHPPLCWLLVWVASWCLIWVASWVWAEQWNCNNCNNGPPTDPPPPLPLTTLTIHHGPCINTGIHWSLIHLMHIALFQNRWMDCPIGSFWKDIANFF